MRRIAVLTAMLTIVFAAVAVAIAPVASASESSAFAAVITEDFCAPATTCGTAVGSLGPATVRSVITKFFRLPSGCFHDEHTTTLTQEDGSSVAFAIVGTLCQTTAPNFRLTGTYAVAGGTGRFTGATGTGFIRAFRENGPIHALAVGTLVLPDNDG